MNFQFHRSISYLLFNKIFHIYYHCCFCQITTRAGARGCSPALISCLTVTDVQLWSQHAGMRWRPTEVSTSSTCSTLIGPSQNKEQWLGKSGAIFLLSRDISAGGWFYYSLYWQTVSWGDCTDMVLTRCPLSRASSAPAGSPWYNLYLTCHDSKLGFIANNDVINK